MTITIPNFLGRLGTLLVGMVSGGALVYSLMSNPPHATITASELRLEIASLQAEVDLDAKTIWEGGFFALSDRRLRAARLAKLKEQLRQMETAQ